MTRKTERKCKTWFDSRVSGVDQSYIRSGSYSQSTPTRSVKFRTKVADFYPTNCLRQNVPKHFNLLYYGNFENRALDFTCIHTLFDGHGNDSVGYRSQTTQRVSFGSISHTEDFLSKRTSLLYSVTGFSYNDGYSWCKMFCLLLGGSVKTCE